MAVVAVTVVVLRSVLVAMGLEPAGQGVQEQMGERSWVSRRAAKRYVPTEIAVAVEAQ